MRTRIIEATNGPQNWGKFLLGRFEFAEWERKSLVDVGAPLLRSIGWRTHPLLVFDLQTGEGALFTPRANANAHADLQKHQIWVCPLFEPFLEWLYRQPEPFEIPDLVDLPDAEFEIYGHRRPGPSR